MLAAVGSILWFAGGVVLICAVTRWVVMDNLKLGDTLFRLLLANGASVLVCLTMAGLQSFGNGGFRPILIVIYLVGQAIVLAADVFFYRRRQGKRFMSSRFRR